MSELKAAVIGAGKLGCLHAEKYAQTEGVKLAFVVDIDIERARMVASRYGAQALADYHEVLGKVDVATVATPSSSHYEIAAQMLCAGVHVLLEKPMAANAMQARKLVEIAAQTNKVLQVGYLERFNPAVRYLRELLHSPRFVESHRLSPFTERGTDVDVVLDLMSHDLDLILSISQAEVLRVEALGVAVLTDLVDVANARISFANGLVANLNASRVAARRERKIRFFQADAYISTNYETRTIQVYRKQPSPSGSLPTITTERIELDDGDPLGEEVSHFVQSVRCGTPPAVSARDGLRVVELCELITNSIEAASQAFATSKAQAEPRRQ